MDYPLITTTGDFFPSGTASYIISLSKAWHIHYVHHQQDATMPAHRGSYKSHQPRVLLTGNYCGVKLPTELCIHAYIYVTWKSLKSFILSSEANSLSPRLLSMSSALYSPFSKSTNELPRGHIQCDSTSVRLSL